MVKINGIIFIFSKISLICLVYEIPRLPVFQKKKGEKGGGGKKEKGSGREKEWGKQDTLGELGQNMFKYIPVLVLYINI